MPILPLDHPEPYLATLGVMLYPGTDETDRNKAAAFAAQNLAKITRDVEEARGLLNLDETIRLFSDTGTSLDDVEKRRWQGTAVGQVFKTFFALYNTDPDLASWENGTRLAEKTAQKHKERGSRSALLEARRRFRTVAHLWAAWCIRDGKFVEHPDAGYEYWHDFQAFLAEAEFLRLWGQTWKPSRSKSKPPLPEDVWRVPDDWSPPERRPDWPPIGQIPILTVEPKEIATLRKAGRPRKKG